MERLIIENKANKLIEQLKKKSIDCSKTQNNIIFVKNHDKWFCIINVELDGYSIFIENEKLVKTVKYIIIPTGKGWQYLVNSTDECIDEVEKLFLEEQNIKLQEIENHKHTSELYKTLPFDRFKLAFEKFMEQADKNSIPDMNGEKKSKGKQNLYGFDGKPECDVPKSVLAQRFGEGRASDFPYMNWYVVSIYYSSKEGSIQIGIKEDLYLHIDEMSIKPLIRNSKFGRMKVAVFYSTTKDTVDFLELYEKFICVSEDVIWLYNNYGYKSVN